MEHSYSGDLDIILTSPNGVEVILFEQAGGSTWLGQATDNDASEELVGIGSDYGWSMNPEYNGTMAEAMLAGNTITLDLSLIHISEPTRPERICVGGV